MIKCCLLLDCLTFFFLKWQFCFTFHVTDESHVMSSLNLLARMKNDENFQIKNSDIFIISAQNIDCGYLLEPH